MGRDSGITYQPVLTVHAARFEKPTSEIEFWFYQSPGNVA